VYHEDRAAHTPGRRLFLDPIRAEGRWFRDAAGRVVILRGVNLGGDCKVPFPDGGTDHPTDFSDHRDVSFVGRPFPLECAEEHFRRLRACGFDCLRLLTTWEAVEHRGPYRFDEPYLDYFARICRMAGEHGLCVVVDFHQDVWSRMTGGDGAPGWLFEKVGLDFTRFGDADAAVVMQYAYDYEDPAPYQEAYPPMCWSRSRAYPANGIMWTLFFGGRLFTPRFLLEDERSGERVNVQDYLQGHFLASQAEVARRLAGLDHVIGFGALNEPAKGWIGASMSERPVHYRRGRPIPMGPAMAPLDALRLSHGIPVELPVNDFVWYRRAIEPVRTVVLNRSGISIWLGGRTDPFQEAGAWKLCANGAFKVRREDFFRLARGRTVDFERDCLVPFWEAAAAAVRACNARWLLFALKEPVESMLQPGLPDSSIDGCVMESHWYDPLVLYQKRLGRINLDLIDYRVVFGTRGIRRKYRRELGAIRAAADRGSVPAFLGEFGVPFDLNGGRAYRRWAAGDRSPRPWRKHVKAFEMIFDALDRALLSGTIWNYTASNRNDPRIGDGFNQEDLSIYSVDQTEKGDGPPEHLRDGARAPQGWLRPYARRIQGTPLAMRFDRRRTRFTLRYAADPGIPAPTEIFVPRLQFPSGHRTTVEEGSAHVQDRIVDLGDGILRVWADRKSAVTVVVRGCRARRRGCAWMPKGGGN
jgi:hypothetical protein